jgi:hypothetical protein
MSKKPIAGRDGHPPLGQIGDWEPPMHSVRVAELETKVADLEEQQACIRALLEAVVKYIRVERGGSAP